MAHIVLPLDGSARSEQALPHALAQLQPSTDELVLVRVVEPYPTSVPPHVSVQLNELLISQAETYLNSWAERLRERGCSVKTLVRSGRPAQIIAAVAHEHGAQMIVLSSHGRGGPSRWLLGSVAENVARAADCPVWLVRSQDPDTVTADPLTGASLPEAPLVLVPLDGSRPSERGLQFATARLAARHARLILMSATDLPALARQARAEVTNLLDHYLGGQVKLLGERDWTAEYTVRDGPAAVEILEVARERRVDLIVMASQGRTGVSRWLVGSVAERVLRHAECPVVLIPQERTQKSEQEDTRREFDHAR